VGILSRKTQKYTKLKCVDIEIALARYFNFRTNVIVPNISWGMFNHECDLLLLSPAGYATEIEIKISKSDLIADKKKLHKHNDHKIKNLYFAIPTYLRHCIKHIPDKAGIILIDQKKHCEIIRKPRSNKTPYKFTDPDKFLIARLGTMRIWGLKERIEQYKNK